MPSPVWFAASLVIVGLSAMTFTNASASLAQLASASHMRGRVTAIRLAILMGGTPIGAPLVGWTADHWGPRWAMGIGAAAGFLAALVGLVYLVRHRHLRLERCAGRWCLQMDDDPTTYDSEVTTGSMSSGDRLAVPAFQTRAAVVWLDSSNQAWNSATTALCAGVRWPGGRGSMNQ